MKITLELNQEDIEIIDRALRVLAVELAEKDQKQARKVYDLKTHIYNMTPN